jgi:tetratricopeptide (TPR) repeat protein
MHAEVVAWPSARPELLVTVFCLAAAVVHAGADATRGPTRARFLAVGAFTMLALLSKETGVLAPVLLGLVTMLRSPVATARGRLEAGVFAAFPYLALVLVFIGIRGLAIHVSSLPPLVGPAGGRAPFRAWGDAALAVAAVSGRYLGVMLVPIDPSSFRVPHWENIAWGLWMLPLAGLTLLLALRNAAFAWLAFAFVAIALQSMGVPSAGYLSQRYTYLPSIGVCAFYGIALQQLFFDAESTTRRRAGMVLTAAMVVGFAALLLPRAMDWTTEPRLWAKAIERDPDSPAPIANHAFMLLDEGRGEEALELFKKIEVVEPGAWMAPYGQANALAAMGRLEESIPLYEKAIQRAPAIPYMYFSLGFVYEDLGNYDKARQMHEQGLALFPNSALAEGVMSTLEAKAGDPAVALKRTEEALSFRPDQPVLRLNRVVLLARNGRADEAIQAAEELTKVKEIASEAHRQLAILYDRYRPDPAAALSHYRESLALSPERPDREQIRRRIAALEHASNPR